jgi:hypothetical protein
MRVLLPKIGSKKDLRIDLTPLPALPFPRVIGNEIISPFKNNVDTPSSSGLTSRFSDHTI